MSANQEQIDYWNGRAGQTWVEAQDRLDAMLAPISEALLQRAAVRTGERVVDIGCGCGDTSLALARSGAEVWGIDISQAMLTHARTRELGLAETGNLAFSLIDAATADFTPDHALLFSRFGVMFFADPVSAFSNLRGALTADGRVCFVCWQAPRENPWMAVAGRAVQPFLPDSAVTPDPRAPGPFAFADPGYVQDILLAAGFSDIELEPFRTSLHVGDDLDDAIRFQSQVGPAARVLSELEGPRREAAMQAVRESLAAHVTSNGIDMAAACWMIMARRG